MNSKQIQQMVFGLILLISTMTLGVQAQNTVTDVTYLLEVTDTAFLPSTVSAGDTVSLAVTLRNKGFVTAAVNVHGELDIGLQFEPIAVSDGPQSIAAQSSKALLFRFRVKPDTPTGHYPALVTFTYERDGQTVTETQTIVIAVSQTEKNIAIRVEPRVISPANPTEMTFFLTNQAATPVSNLTLRWEEENNLILPLGTDNRAYVPLLNGLQTQSVTYTVTADPNIATGVYPLNVTLTYTDANGIRTQTTQVGVVIGGGTDFEVSADLLSSGTLSVSIANIGSNNASAVVVKIPAQVGIRISGSSTVILGNLNKGDYTVANFSASTGDQNRLTATRSGVQTGGNTGGIVRENGFPVGTAPTNTASDTTPPLQGAGISRETPIEILIEYTDTTGTRQRVSKTVLLAAAAASSFSTGNFNRNSNDWMVWVIGAVLVGGAWLFRKWKFPSMPKRPFGYIVAGIAVVFLGIIFLTNANLTYTAIAAIISLAILAWSFNTEKSRLRSHA